VRELGIIKRCELCKGYLNCKTYDEVCDNLNFLQKFLDIKGSSEIAKHCKSYGILPKINNKKKRMNRDYG